MMRAKGANSFWTLGPANRERCQAGVQGDDGSVPGLTHNLRVKSGPSRVDLTAEWGKVFAYLAAWRRPGSRAGCS